MELENTAISVIVWVIFSGFMSFLFYLSGDTQIITEINKLYLPTILFVAIIGLIADILEIK